MNSILNPVPASLAPRARGSVVGGILNPRQSGAPALSGLSSGVMIMSNIQSGTAIIGAHVATAAPAKAVFTPSSVLKMDIDGALSRRIVSIVAVADGGNISGRAVGLKLADYAALAGARSADSVATAVCYAVVHFMNGTAKLADLTAKPVPAWLGTRVAEAFSSAKPTNSCDESALRTYAGLIAHGISKAVKPVLVEPKVEKKAQVESPAPAGAAVPVPLEFPLNAAIAMLGSDLDNKAAATRGAELDAALARAQEAAERESERAARAAEYEAQLIADFAKRKATVHAKAVAFAELASFFGIKLTKGQLAVLDAAEGVKQAA